MSDSAKWLGEPAGVRSINPPARSGEETSLAGFQAAEQPARLSLYLRLGLIGVLTLYLLVAVAFSRLHHFSRAFDEGYHLEYIVFIKQHGRLPVTYEERAEIARADFPPLYHLLVSLVSAPVSVEGPPTFKYFWDSFRYRAIDHQAGNVWTLATEDTRPPYLGRFLVWQIGRWLSIFLSLATLIIVYSTLRQIPPIARYPWLPLAGVALLAFIPRYTILSATLNDDNLLGVLAALYFWLLVKIIHRPRLRWPWLALGAVLGLSLTVKYTLVVAPLELVVIGWLLARRLGWGWRRLATRLAWAGAPALLGAAWWFGWNLWFLNTVAEEGWLAGLLRPLLAGGKDQTLNRLGGLLSDGQVGRTALPEDIVVGAFPQWLQSTFLTFWGVDPGLLFPYIYILIGLFLLAAIWGGWRIWQTSPVSAAQPASWTGRAWLALLAFHVAIFFILPLFRFILTRRLSVAAQGRHILIPAAAAIAGLLVWGLVTLLPVRWQRAVLAGVIAIFAGWTGLHLYQFAGPAQASPLPLRTVSEAAAWLPHPVEAQFGPALTLASYDLQAQPEAGRLRLELGWRSLAQVNENYLLNVELVDATGQVVAHWIGYNGQGRLPTLAWDPGDAVFDRLALPLVNLPAGSYNLRLQVSGATGPLPVNGGPETSLVLTQVPIGPVQFSFPDQVGSTGPGSVSFALWRPDGPANSTLPPVYRYPTTISVIVDQLEPGTQLDIAMLDAAGQAWPVTQSGAGIYHFVIGPRWLGGAYRLQIARPGAEPIITEPLLTVENWWKRTFVAPPIEQPLEANLADQLRLLGYKLPRRQVKAGESFPITLYWQALPDKAPQADFIQFNHLVDSTGALRGGYDRRPLEYYSTLLWAPGEVVIDGYTVPVDPDAPPGEYYLNVGLYLVVGEAAVNLPLVVDGRPGEATSVTIGPIEVVAP